MKKKLTKLGFEHVINECRDFYADIENNTIPVHDVLITNPPYSKDHMQRIFRFCTHDNGDRPWLILVPSFVFTKNYYPEAIGDAEPCFLVPRVQYRYYPPAWALAEAKVRHAHEGDWTSPFPTFWYIHAGTDSATDRLREHALELQRGGGVVFAETVAELPQDARPDLAPPKKRTNPKARKRRAKLKKELGAGKSITPPGRHGEDLPDPRPKAGKKKRRY